MNALLWLAKKFGNGFNTLAVVLHLLIESEGKK